MANKRILKLTNTEAIIKIDGAVGASTIDLDVDLLLDSEALDGVTQEVNIVSILATGAAGGAISFVRDGLILYSLTTDTISDINLQDFGGVSDFTNNTNDLVITTSGAECQCIIKLRKVSGYKTKLQGTQFGIYDDPDVLD